jgi:hypothetical protein
LAIERFFWLAIYGSRQRKQWFEISFFNAVVGYFFKHFIRRAERHSFACIRKYAPVVPAVAYSYAIRHVHVVPLACIL